MRIATLLFLFFFATPVFSQEMSRELCLHKVDEITQTDLKPTFKALYLAKTDEEKNKLNAELQKTFETALSIQQTFDYDFDSLQKDIKILRSNDNMFRIVNWHCEKADGTFEYFGFIQSKHIEIHKKGMFHKTKTESIQLYPLIDKSADIKNPDNNISDNKKWYGMLYYKIIPSNTKTRKYYTLLGWDGNDKFSQKKIIDVLSFDNTGVPHFGADIFSYQKKYPKRIIFEYGASCSMSLKYSSKKDSIVFGHLAPTEPKFEGQYQYYCSDMSFDGFGFKKGKWNYGEDVKALNEKDDNDKQYHDPHDRSPGSDQSNVIERKKKKKKKKQ